MLVTNVRHVACNTRTYVQPYRFQQSDATKFGRRMDCDPKPRASGVVPALVGSAVHLQHNRAMKATLATEVVIVCANHRECWGSERRRRWPRAVGISFLLG